MKAIEEIIEYYRQESKNDPLGFEGQALLPYLSAEQAREFLQEGADLSEWQQAPLMFESIVKQMREYMSFAWDKVQDHRGISASRSVSKMQAWLWLLGEEELLAFAKDERNYPQYGAPILKRICEKYGFLVPTGPGIENMAKGQKCSPGCAGCGSGWTTA